MDACWDCVDVVMCTNARTSKSGEKKTIGQISIYAAVSIFTANMYIVVNLITAAKYLHLVAYLQPKQSSPKIYENIIPSVNFVQKAS